MNLLSILLAVLLLAVPVYAMQEDNVSTMLASLAGEDFSYSHPAKDIWIVEKANLTATVQLLDFLRSEDGYYWPINGTLCIYKREAV